MVLLIIEVGAIQRKSDSISLESLEFQVQNKGTL